MSIRLLCLGDVMLGENLSHYKRGIRSKFQSDYKKLIPSVISNMLKTEVDLIFYNFEYCVADQKNFEGKTLLENVFKGTPESISLFEGNQVIVNVANNHFGQHGTAVSKHTKELLKSKGIYVTGASNEPTVINMKNSNVLFWGVTLVKDQYEDTEYFKADYKTLLQKLQLPDKKGENEQWVISIHWGDEYLNSPSLEQNILAKQLIDNGFDLIIGHHSHTLQPVEYYKEKLILYSLGNFIFDQNFSRRTTTGLMVNVLLDKNPKIVKSFLTSQKDYFVKKIEEVSLKSIYHKPSYGLYKYKNIVLNKWYRLLMKFELLIHFNELDKESVDYLLRRFK